MAASNLDSDSDSIVSWTPSAESVASSPCSIVPWTPPVSKRAYEASIAQWTPPVPEKSSETSIVPWSESDGCTPQSIVCSVVPWSGSDGPTPQSNPCNEVRGSPHTPTRGIKIAMPSKQKQAPIATTIRKKIDFSFAVTSEDRHKKGMYDQEYMILYIYHPPPHSLECVHM